MKPSLTASSLTAGALVAALPLSGTLRRVSVRLAIMAVRMFTPLALLRVLLDAWRFAQIWPRGLRQALRGILATWAVAECAFLVYIRQCSRQLDLQSTRRWRAVGVHSSEERREKSLERYLHTIHQIYMGGDLSNEQPQAAKPALAQKAKQMRPGGLGMKPKTTNASAGNLMGLVRNSSFFDGIIDAGRPGLELEKQLSFDNLVRDLDSRSHSSLRINSAICDEDLLRLYRVEMSGFFHGEGRGNVEEPEQWLRRGNVEEWLAHYFFRGSAPADLGSSERDELRKMTTRVLEHLGLPDLPEGYNSKLKTHRLLSDPLPYLHRPLFMYALNGMVFPLLTSQVMRRLGFDHERVGGLCYWHRKPQSCKWDIAAGKKLPLILVHGLGVGLVPYYFFIVWLSQNYSWDIYVPELPFLASRPYENIPSAREVVAQIQSMLTIDGHRSGYFVGHSYGCVVVGWLQKFSSCVRCLTLMEPALFLIMHSETVMGRILYGQPKTCLELFYRYFVFRELFTVNLLCRNFFWEQSTMYPEEVSVPMLIQLASDDAVIASRSVRRIAEHERARRKKDAKRSQARTTGSSFDLRQDLLQCSSASPVVPLEVHWSEGFFHGMILGHKPEATKLFHKMRSLVNHLDGGQASEQRRAPE